MSQSKTVILADPSALVPWPGVPGRDIPAEPFQVDPYQPFWAALIRDGTLIAPPAKPAGRPKS